VKAANGVIGGIGSQNQRGKAPGSRRSRKLVVDERNVDMEIPTMSVRSNETKNIIVGFLFWVLRIDWPRFSG